MMKVNIYDFDKTIYNGDSTVDFYKYCIKKKKKILFYIPKTFFYFIKYKLGLINKTKFKEAFFSYLCEIEKIDDLINDFWKENKNKIKQFYLSNNHENDIIISASPEFLIKPMCKNLGVKDVIASKVDKHTGIFLGENCRGIEKVNRFKAKYKSVEVVDVYSDSYSDIPIFKLGTNAYLVKGEKIKKLEKSI